MPLSLSEIKVDQTERQLVVERLTKIIEKAETLTNVYRNCHFFRDDRMIDINVLQDELIMLRMSISSGSVITDAKIAKQEAAELAAKKKKLQKLQKG